MNKESKYYEKDFEEDEEAKMFKFFSKYMVVFMITTTVAFTSLICTGGYVCYKKLKDKHKTEQVKKNIKINKNKVNTAVYNNFIKTY